jgi:hypothetical protein
VRDQAAADLEAALDPKREGSDGGLADVVAAHGRLVQEQRAVVVNAADIRLLLCVSREEAARDRGLDVGAVVADLAGLEVQAATAGIPPPSLT